MQILKIVDTNILLDFPQIIEEESGIIIITDVLRELDGLKLNPNFETAFKARRAAVTISRNLDRIIFRDDYEETKLPVDDKLLLMAQGLDTLGELITNDVYLKVKAHIKGIPTHGYGSSENYSGVRTLYLQTDENKYNADLDYMLNEHKFPVPNVQLCENEFVIVKDSESPIKNRHGEEDYEVLATFIYQNGKLTQFFNGKIENKWFKKPIMPRNPEQSCLFEALSDRNKTIIYAGGKFGTGKSFILNNFAIQELEKGKIKKIVYVPNNSYTENTMDIGALPGELLEKVTGQIGPLVDLVGIDEVQEMIRREELEVVPMNSIRGRSFQDTIIIVNEAQNLTEDHIKLLIARCGEGSRIFFDGDLKQADSAIFRNKNGLKLLLNLRKSPVYSKIFATVKLITTERSLTAQASSFLDDLTGGI